MIESVSFSQWGEDVVLEKCFFRDRPTGFYVDVGGFDPLFYSNTHLFYRKGWSGINIEPNPHGFQKFKRQRPRDINLNLAISDQASSVRFTVDSAYSGIDDGSHAFKGRNPNAKSITVQAKPLSDVLSEHLPSGTVIDFMSIDCEGHDQIVLESNDWGRFSPKVLLAEELSSDNFTTSRFLESKNFRFFCRLNLTNVYVSESLG